MDLRTHGRARHVSASPRWRSGETGGAGDTSGGGGRAALGCPVGSGVSSAHREQEVGVAFGVAPGPSWCSEGGRAPPSCALGRVSVYRSSCVSVCASAFALVEVSVRPRARLRRALQTVLEAAGRYVAMTWLDPFHSRTSIGLIGKPDAMHAVVGAIDRGEYRWRACRAAGIVRREGRLAARGDRDAPGCRCPIAPPARSSPTVCSRRLPITMAVAVALALRAAQDRGYVGGGVLAFASVLATATNARAGEYREERRASGSSRRRARIRYQPWRRAWGSRVGSSTRARSPPAPSTSGRSRSSPRKAWPTSDPPPSSANNRGRVLVAVRTLRRRIQATARPRARLPPEAQADRPPPRSPSSTCDTSIGRRPRSRARRGSRTWRRSPGLSFAVAARAHPLRGRAL